MKEKMSGGDVLKLAATGVVCFLVGVVVYSSIDEYNKTMEENNTIKDILRKSMVATTTNTLNKITSKVDPVPTVNITKGDIETDNIGTYKTFTDLDSGVEFKLYGVNIEDSEDKNPNTN